MTIPETHLDLIAGPITVALTTILPSGALQSTAVWCLFEDGYLYISTQIHTRKARNLQERPQATILAIDPQNPQRYVELRGHVDQMASEGAVDRLRQILSLYNSLETYFNMDDPVRVILRFVPEKIVTRG